LGCGCVWVVGVGGRVVGVCWGGGGGGGVWGGAHAGPEPQGAGTPRGGNGAITGAGIIRKKLRSEKRKKNFALNQPFPRTKTL